MEDLMRFEGSKEQKMLAVAIAFGFVLSILGNVDLIYSIITLLGGQDFPKYGITIFDYDSNSCEYYTLEEYLPGGISQIDDTEPKECFTALEASMKYQKMKEINRSLKSQDMSRLTSEAGQALGRNDSRVIELFSRIQINKTYSIQRE